MALSTQVVYCIRKNVLGWSYEYDLHSRVYEGRGHEIVYELLNKVRRNECNFELQK